MSTLDLFRTTWGSSLRELVGPEPASLEGELAPMEEGLQVSRAERAPIVAALSRWLWSHNQFLRLDEELLAELSTSVERALRAMQRSKQARPALRRHRAELSALVRRELGEEPREVRCAEYSAALQLDVLGLAGRTLEPPVLDVGCGEQAKLVQALRAQGLEATGIDRVVDPALGTSLDFLRYDYGEARWGSVLSHQAFSLHFLHHHHQERKGDADAAYAYARVYMAILRSLRVGGTFAYAPGLPFLEPLLQPSAFAVTRVPFASALRVPALQDVEQRTGLALSYATHVTRRK